MWEILTNRTQSIEAIKEATIVNRYDSYCGVYCGACDIMNAKSNEDRVLVIQSLENNLPDWHATPEQIHCSGCKTDNAFIYCSKCPFRDCAKSKKVEFCIECDEFPCQPYNQLVMAADKIPVLKHHKANMKNLKYIKTKGLDEWLVDQEAKWKCPNCGASFSRNEEKCGSCQHNLKGIKDYEVNN
jgi:hypothetical protein